MKTARSKAQTLGFAPVWLFAALMLAASLLIVAQAQAQSSDPVIAAARSAGQVGEQADGYVGVVAGQTVSADVRAHVDQLNIRRRAAYTSQAAQSGASTTDFAAAVACQLFDRIGVGERYRDESGQWRQRTASDPVRMPSFCGNH